MSNYERDEQRRQELELESKEEKAWNMTDSVKKMSKSPQYDPTLRYDDPAVRISGDPVHHPAHYTFGKIEVLDAIEDWGLDYHRGNVVKYMVRAGKKDPDKMIEDLRKARFYIDRLIKLKQENRDGIDFH